MFSQTPNDTHAPMYNGRGSGGRDAPEKAFGGGGPPLGAMQTNGPSLPPGVMAGGLGGGVTGGDAEISLRPARTFTSLKPNTPSMLPKSAQINVHSHTPPVSGHVICHVTMLMAQKSSKSSQDSATATAKVLRFFSSIWVCADLNISWVLLCR